ncbi:MAG: hypothetical protein AVDCRST_MAG59-2826, partial [uncultured Thermomicrobiales bacterium]
VQEQRRTGRSTAAYPGRGGRGGHACGRGEFVRPGAGDGPSPAGGRLRLRPDQDRGGVAGHRR